MPCQAQVRSAKPGREHFENFIKLKITLCPSCALRLVRHYRRAWSLGNAPPIPGNNCGSPRPSLVRHTPLSDSIKCRTGWQSSPCRLLAALLGIAVGRGSRLPKTTDADDAGAYIDRAVRGWLVTMGLLHHFLYLGPCLETHHSVGYVHRNARGITDSAARQDCLSRRSTSDSKRSPASDQITLLPEITPPDCVTSPGQWPAGRFSASPRPRPRQAAPGRCRPPSVVRPDEAEAPASNPETHEGRCSCHLSP